MLIKIREKQKQPRWAKGLEQNLQDTREQLNTVEKNLNKPQHRVEVLQTEAKGSGGVFKLLAWTLGLAALTGGAAVLSNRLKLRRELKQTSLNAMPGLKLDRLVGQWYEIAKFPGKGSERKVGIMVHYHRVDEHTLQENYIYQEKDFSGPIIEKQAEIKILDPDKPAKMQKSGRGPFALNYWVLEVGAEYDYAVIGSPDYQNLWILSRTPDMNPEKYAAMVYRLNQLGFDTEQLVKVPQQSMVAPVEPVKPLVSMPITQRELPQNN